MTASDLPPPTFFTKNSASAVDPEPSRNNTFQQKFILQTRNEQGHIISLGTFDRLISPEEAVQLFGDRDYTLKGVSPRFSVAWKYKPDRPAATTVNPMQVLRTDLEKLSRKTKLHSYALVGMGAVTALGFGLSHLRFLDTEKRVTRLEAIAGTLSAGILQCPNCGNRLVHMLQHYCGKCRVQLTWPENLSPPPPTAPARGALTAELSYPSPITIAPTAGPRFTRHLRFSGSPLNLHGETFASQKKTWQEIIISALFTR